MYQQNNSPPRNYQPNLSLNAPQGQFSGQAPQVSLNAPQGQFSPPVQPSTYNNQYGGSGSLSTNISGPPPAVSLSGGQFSAQGPTANLSGPAPISSGNYSGGQFSTQGNTSNLGPTPISAGNFSSTHQETSFGRGPELNINGGQQGQFSGQNNFSNNQYSAPEANISLNGPGNFNGPEANVNFGGNQEQQYNSSFDSNVMPTTPQGIKQFIHKRPFTQNLDGEDLTYSIIPKKQQSFVLTNERFLLLKGIQILGYAREFPQNQILPFRTLADVPAPKSVVQLGQIDKVEVQDDKLIVKHADQAKTIWEFVCPSKRCAVEWNQKIHEALELFREFQMGNYSSVQDFYRMRKGISSNFNANTNFEHKFQSSPPREPYRIEPQPIPQTNFNTQPVPQTNFNARVNHDDEVSRSVFDSSGPRANLNVGGTFNSNIQGSSYNQTSNSPTRDVNYGSPVKTNQYEANYQVSSSPPQAGLNVNANYQGSTGSTQNTSFGGGRSYTVSSSSSFGRYPMGMPMGGQQPMTYHSNTRNL